MDHAKPTNRRKQHNLLILVNDVGVPATKYFKGVQEFGASASIKYSLCDCGLENLEVLMLFVKSQITNALI